MNRLDLKILFGVAAPTARGGINACEPPFIAALRSLGVECIEEQYPFDNDSSTSLFQRIKQVVKATRKLKRITEHQQIDLIHLNSSFEVRSILRDSFCVLFLGHSKKIFLKFHGSEPYILKNRNYVIRILARLLIKRCAAIGVLSSEEKKEFIALGVPETKIRIIKNSVVAPSVFEQTVRTEGTSRLLFVSRLVSTKGLDDAIRTLKILRGMEIHAHLDVLGDGESRSDAEDLAKELGVEDQVTFHGHVSESEVARFYTKVDLLFFPTKHAEGFPMVIFTALSYGLPIITTKIRAMADYLVDGSQAIFVSSNDPNDCAAKISSLLRNPTLMQQMSENAKKLAEHFYPERIASEYIDTYKELLGRDRD